MINWTKRELQAALFAVLGLLMSPALLAAEADDEDVVELETFTADLWLRQDAAGDAPFGVCR